MLSVKKTDIPQWQQLQATLGDGVEIQNLSPGANGVELNYSFTSGGLRPILQTFEFGQDALPENYRGWTELRSLEVRDGRIEARLREGPKLQPEPVSNPRIQH